MTAIPSLRLPTDSSASVPAPRNSIYRDKAASNSIPPLAARARNSPAALSCSPPQEHPQWISKSHKRTFALQAISRPWHKSLPSAPGFWKFVLSEAPLSSPTKEKRNSFLREWLTAFFLIQPRKRHRLRQQPPPHSQIKKDRAKAANAEKPSLFFGPALVQSWAVWLFMKFWNRPTSPKTQFRKRNSL